MGCQKLGLLGNWPGNEWSLVLNYIRLHLEINACKIKDKKKLDNTKRFMQEQFNFVRHPIYFL